MKKVLFVFVLFFLCFFALYGGDDFSWWYVSTANAVAPPLFLEDARTLVVNSDGSYVFLSDKGKKLKSSWLDIRPYGTASLSKYGSLVVTDKDGGLFAFSRSLSLLWEQRLDMAFYPALSAYGDVFAIGADNSLIRINPAGRLLWALPLSDGKVAALFTAYGLVFAAVDNVLYAVTYGGYVLWRHEFAFDIKTAVPYGKRTLVVYDGKALTSLDVDDNILWSVSLPGLYDTVLLSSSDRLALISGSGDAFFISHDGNLLRSFKIPFTIKSSLSCISDNGILIAVSEKNRVLAIMPDDSIEDISPGKKQPYRGVPLYLAVNPANGQLLLATSDWIVYGLDFFVQPSSAWGYWRGYNNAALYQKASSNYTWWKKSDEFIYLKALVDSSKVEDNLRAISIIDKQIEKGNLAGKLDFYLYCIDLLGKKGIESSDMSRLYSQVRAKAYELAGKTGDSSMLYLLLSGLKYEVLPNVLEGVLKGISYYGFDPDGIVSGRMSRLLKRLPDDTLFAVSPEFITALSVILKYNKGSTAEKQAMEMVSYILHGPFPAGIRKKAIELLH